MPSPILLIGLCLALLAIVPTRRLVLRGTAPMTVAAYFLVLWLTSFAIVAAPGRPRLLLPIVVILALLPFVTWRRGLDRLLGRRQGDEQPPPRNVTPPGSGAPQR